MSRVKSIIYWIGIVITVSSVFFAGENLASNGTGTLTMAFAGLILIYASK